ncbi:hypothetical protein [Microvirga sp. P5_D2]
MRLSQVRRSLVRAELIVHLGANHEELALAVTVAGCINCTTVSSGERHGAADEGVVLVFEVLLGDADPDKWDVPPKPKGMGWATYERWVARYDAAEEMLDAQLAMAAARLMKRL